MDKEKLELVEEYNQQGVCVRRTINGHELPADKEPSVVIFKNVESISQKFYSTTEETKQRHDYLEEK